MSLEIGPVFFFVANYGIRWLFDWFSWRFIFGFDGILSSQSDFSTALNGLFFFYALALRRFDGPQAAVRVDSNASLRFSSVVVLVLFCLVWFFYRHSPLFFSCASQCFDRFYQSMNWVLQGFVVNFSWLFIKCYWVVLGFTGFYCDLGDFFDFT